MRTVDRIISAFQCGNWVIEPETFVEKPARKRG
jgi:hypothetical protein